MGWTVYILRCGDGTLYTGCTNDLPRRLAAHRSGRGAKYTRSRLPVEPVYREEAADKSAALRREAAMAFFVAYCAGLAALTLFPANFWTFSGQSKFFLFLPWNVVMSNLAYLPPMLEPFHEIRRVLQGGSYWGIFLLAGNIIMFMPIGFFPALLWKNWRWWKSLLAGFCTSCTIEFVQLFVGRSTDIDDVILNTTGGDASWRN